MKSFYLFILLFIIIGCKSNILDRQKSKIVDCPTVLFAKEHKIYVDSKFDDISLNNISYKAEVNNAVFNKECKIKDNIFSSKISILFVVTPLIQEQENIDLPFYIATLDKKNTIEKIEYFLINGNFKKDFETDIFKETEITTTEIINFKLTDRPEKIVIGFMIDELKLELFN